ncbi:PAS domain S-box protein [Methyloglobulus sp.]|uniref:PAS domain S-box protein n=1 Tax=Methyloglobulus sp. TaxID=2518622 RepID=UPI0032B79F89
MKNSLKKFAAPTAGLGILLVVVVVVASFRAFKLSETSAEIHMHTLVVIKQANELLSELTDAETGERGYALTGNEAFLEPYLKVRNNISNHLLALSKLTLNSAAQKHLDALVPLIDAKLSEIATVVELRRNHDISAIQATIANNEGKRLMDLMRLEMSGFLKIEEGLLARHDAILQSNMKQLFYIIVATSLFMGLFVFAFTYFIYRETQQRLKNLVHLETQHFLEKQEEINKQLELTNLSLKISEEKLGITLNSIGDAVIATDTQARVTLINPVAEQLTGWAQAEAIGRPVDEIFHIINKETHHLALIPVMNALTHGTIQGLANHTVLIARNGSERDIADSCAPIRGLDNKIVGSVLVFRDVTEEYALQQALHDSNALVHAIVNTVVDSIITLRFNDYTIQTINSTTEKMFGYSPAELIGQNFNLLMPGLDQDIGKQCLTVANKNDNSQNVGFGREVVGRRKNGSMFPMEIAIGEMWLNGGHYLTGILRDITVTKRLAEESLRFFAISQEMLSVVGFDGYFKSLNLAWEKTLGYTLAELLVKPFIEVVHPDDRQTTQAEVDRLKNGGDDANFQNRYLCKDGSYRWFSWSVTTSIQDQLFYCSARDITERKLYEAEQKRLHGRAQLALDAGQLGDWSWDAATDQVSLGHLAAHIFGFPEGISVTRAQLRERLTTEDAEHAREAWDKALIEHTDYRNEYRVRRLDGLCWVAITGRGNYAEDGKALGMNGVMQDINERKLAELAKLRLAAIVESSDDAIVSKDLQGIITSWNAGAEKLFGYSAAEIIGQPISRLIPTQRQVEKNTILTEIKRGADIKHFETVRLRKDGSCIDVSVTISPIKDLSGTVIGASKVARDITGRKVAESKLLEAMAAAEKANRAKSEFLSSMSHELRTPLNAILGFAQLLEVSNPPPTASQLIKIEQIVKAGWYLLELINEILDLALIESGKLSLSQETVSIIDVLSECRAMIEPLAQQRGIKLTFVPFDQTWVIHADRTRLKQALLNLLSNALKYNCENGTIEVVCSTNITGQLRITIKDSGAGLHPEKLGQLFQPFNRLGQETGSEEGTGIGLMVTQQLVELMGGKVGVDSTVGVGSEFWIELSQNVTPELELVAGNTMPKRLVPQPHKNTALHTLLYVEDNPANLLLVEQIIKERPDFTMLSAHDAKPGIALARSHQPDIILMDVNLPGISGSQALKILHEDPATAHIPVIAISANAMPSDIEKGLKSGFFRYLTKPIKVGELMNALDDALKSSNIRSMNTNETGQIR